MLRRIETHIPTCDDLSLPDTIKQLAMSKRGLIILVGATVAGKPTSLAAVSGSIGGLSLEDSDGCIDFGR